MSGSRALADLVDEYLDDLEPRVGTHTLALRASVLKRIFLPWAAREGPADLDELDGRAAGRFSLRLQREPGPSGKPLSPTSVQTYCRELNIFLRWAGEHAGGDATVRAEAPPLRRRTLELLTREEIAALEAAADAPRDKLIVRLLADTGIRVGELLNLRPADFVREQGRCFVRVRGKTGGRVVGIESALYRRVRAYADGGRPGQGGDATPLFVAVPHSGRRAGSPLTPNGVGQVLRELRHRAGLRKRVYPHLLRHSYATDFYRATKDAVGLKAILGHKSLAMIERVYVHLAADDVHDAMVGYLKGRRKAAG
jgi:integrase